MDITTKTRVTSVVNNWFYQNIDRTIWNIVTLDLLPTHIQNHITVYHGETDWINSRQRGHYIINRKYCKELTICGNLNVKQYLTSNKKVWEFDVQKYGMHVTIGFVNTRIPAMLVCRTFSRRISDIIIEYFMGQVTFKWRRKHHFWRSMTRNIIEIEEDDIIKISISSAAAINESVKFRLKRFYIKLT